MARIKFMNTEVDNLTMSETLDTIDSIIRQRRSAYVVTPNVDHIVKLEHDKKLQKVYANADLILTDGKPLIWISRFYKTPIKEKISGSDLFPLLSELAAKRGYTMYFLGGKEGVAELARKNLTRRYPGLSVVGTNAPERGFEKKPEEIRKIIEDIREKKPDILIVALGCPKQEYFMYEYRKAMEVPVSLGLGASIDFEAGTVKRAPKWMSNHGLEWLYRFIKEPKRMFRRYFIDDLKIVHLIFKYRTSGKNNKL